MTSSARTICANTPATQEWSGRLTRRRTIQTARGEVQAGTVGSVNIAVNENEPVAFVVPAEGVAAYDDYTGLSACSTSHKVPTPGRDRRDPLRRAAQLGAETRPAYVSDPPKPWMT